MFLYFSPNPEGRLWAPGQHLPLVRADFSSCFFIESRRTEKPGTHYAPLTEIKYKRTMSISHERQNLILILFSETWGDVWLNTQPTTTEQAGCTAHELQTKFSLLGFLALSFYCPAPQWNSRVHILGPRRFAKLPSLQNPGFLACTKVCGRSLMISDAEKRLAVKQALSE